MCRQKCKESRRNVKTSIVGDDGGKVKTHQPVEWAGQHQSASVDLGRHGETLRGPGCLGGTCLTLGLLGSKLGLPPQCNVVLVTTIC